MCMRKIIGTHTHIDKLFCNHVLFLEPSIGFMRLQFKLGRVLVLRLLPEIVLYISSSFIICRNSNSNEHHMSFEHPPVELLLNCCPRIRPRRKPANVLESCGTPEAKLCDWMYFSMLGHRAGWLIFSRQFK